MDLGKLNILVVEDDSDTQERIVREFNSLNFATTTASSFYEAKTIIQNSANNFDLFLIDIQLPDGDGFSLISEIRNKNKDALLIIMTGYINNKIMDKSNKIDCYEVIQKPFSIKNDIIPLAKKCLKNIYLKKENDYLNAQILHISKLAALGELSATVVHDIRGPLTMIQLTCEDIKDEMKKTDNNESFETNLNSHLSQITRACHKINKLVDHLRNYSRKDAQEEEESKSVIELIENSVFLVKQKIRNHNIKVEIKIDEKYNNAELICFPNKFEQVLMNLMSNACDAMKESSKKELKIKAFLDDNSFNISVNDTGSGIPEVVLPKIFDSFFTTKPKGEGTGLGLSIVKNIVKEHLGDLVLSSVVGEGTTFTIKLPISKLIIKPSSGGGPSPSRAA
ncbi:response regulator [Silvanigrella paludirubra]|uniref:histidine kinase n=1 Tax=Silvanigrella paludirubra TaxID=2499159 RepID=A0A6N6VUD3_9BACT|nr:hybrid sensor histidine kinase/response regulator [Silvanigrella paludirubra]KAB8037791.1 response regulator [Silvanigrella paludirubra]